MNARVAAILLVLLVVLGGGALLYYQQERARRPQNVATLGRTLLQDLRIADVASIPNTIQALRPLGFQVGNDTDRINSATDCGGPCTYHYVAFGPHALGLISDTEETRHLAEFGVVFLMFSIGLEFSLSKLRVMRRLVFGLGLAQVLLSIAICVAVMARFGREDVVVSDRGLREGILCELLGATS